MIRPLLQQYKRVVVDFSFIANLKSREMRHDFIDDLLEEDCEVAVSQDFFENCEVVRQSHFEEQEELIRRIEEFTEKLQQKKRFFRFEDVYSPETVVNALASNPKVCFAFHCISEFAEAVLADFGNLKAALLITDCDGETVCPKDPEEIRAILYPEVDPDILLMDIRMEGMSGLEEGREILKEDPSARILFLTTFNDDEYLEEFFC